MKKYLIGMVAGAILATTASVYADEGLEKVEAYLRPSLPITLNGQAVKLESSPVMYDGSTYLKLRDVAALTGLEVNWNDTTQTVELGTNGGKSMTSSPATTDIPEKTVEERIAELKQWIETEKSSIEHSKNMIKVNEAILSDPKAAKGDLENITAMYNGFIAENEARIAKYEKQIAELEKQQ